MRSSNAATVGLPMRLVDVAVGAQREQFGRVLGRVEDEARTIDRSACARAPVAGSGGVPACSARVRKPNSWSSTLETTRYGLAAAGQGGTNVDAVEEFNSRPM